MKKQFKKLTAVLLTAVMLLGMFTTMPVSVFAADVDDNSVGAFTSSDGKYEYTKNDDGTITISSLVDKWSTYNGTLPDVIDGYTVTKIGDKAFYECYYLQSIVLPDTITSIGDYAFYNCKRLETIKMSDSLTSIGVWAFGFCSSLSRYDTIKIPDSVTTIGARAFYCCNYLNGIELPNGITTIEEQTFIGCQNLYHVNIPDSVTSIGWSAFESCENLNLNNIKLPDGLKYIKDGAFKKCASSYLNKVTIPKYTIIEGNPFESVDIKIYGYKYLNSKEYTSAYKYADKYGITFISLDVKPFDYVVLSDGSIEITKCNFNRDDYNEYYGDSINYEKGILSIPDKIDGYRVTSIGDGVFSYSDFDKIYVPSSVTKVGNSAFSNCKSVTLCGSITYIGSSAFSRCGSFSFMSSLKNLKYIGSYAFAETGIDNMNIPGTLNEIPEGLFYGCSYLIEVKIGEGVKSIGKNAFYGTNISTLNIPDSVTNIDGFLNVRYIGCNRGTATHKYAIDYKIKYTILDAIKGDVDLDGEVNIKDATRLQMMLTYGYDYGLYNENIHYSYSDMWNIDDVADLNGDIKINVEDVTLLQKNIAKYDNQ